MGNTSSVPERIYKAARANDVSELQGLCRDMRLNGALDVATKRKWLNWTDAEGRTALHHACQRNYLQVAQMLLDEGADVHLIAPKRAGGGSPLAEAVAGKHEGLVELLLRYGADPFTENKAGKAPLDLALELKAANILRSFERHALFAGYVNMKVLQLKGFSHAAKDRWVVVAPRFSPPSEGSGGVGIVRIMMLVYRNAAEAEPRTKCWLDGASIFRAGQEAVLRLHANHEQPRNAFTKYDNGWMLFFKQATTSYSTPSAAAAGPTGGTNPAGVAAGAAATYAAFMAVCYRPLDHLQAQQQMRAAGAAPAAGANPFGNPAQYSSSSGSGNAAAQGTFNPWWQQQQQRPAALPSVNPGPSSVPTSPTGFPTSPMSPFTQQQQYQHHAGLSLQPAGAPPQAAQQRPPALQQQQQPWPEEVLHAQPGETDEQFARRLASLVGGVGSGSNSGGSSPSASGRLSSAAATMPNSRLGSSASQQLLQPQPQQQPGLYPSLSAPAAGVTGGSADADAPSAPPAADLPLTSANPFRPAAAAAASSAAPQAALAPGVAAVAAAAAAGAPLQPGSVAGAQQMPAAGSSASLAAAGPTGGSASSGDQDLCVICLVEAREVGFLHGASVHKCVCRDCASLIQPNSPCPMCRQPIERIIGVY